MQQDRKQLVGGWIFYFSMMKGCGELLGKLMTTLSIAAFMFRKSKKENKPSSKRLFPFVQSYQHYTHRHHDSLG